LKSRSWNNPVITSEMKIKMRGWRTALGIAAYLGVLLLIGFLYYLAFIESSYAWNTSVNARQEAGMQILISEMCMSTSADEEEVASMIDNITLNETASD
jgi:hypothetical protein